MFLQINCTIFVPNLYKVTGASAPIKSNQMKKNQSPLEAFIDSGRFMSRQNFLDKYPESVLISSCTDVIVYSVLEQTIQVLSTGEFYYNDNIRGFVLDDVEAKIFSKISEK